MSRYVLGFDFGTLSCRGVALDLNTGKMAATAESPYKNGVISREMKHKPIKLEPEWFLQDPDDWLESMVSVSREMLREGRIKPEEVAGIGTDFTSCTLIPIKKDGTPLCKMDRFRDIPNAWPKLWKHHGAQPYAERIEKYAKENTTWLKEYFGNSVSSEWVYPKMLQVAEENPEIYIEADYFIEAVDYIVMLLTGINSRNSGILGVNAFWVKGKGYPDAAFARALNPLLEDAANTKLAGDIVKAGDYVGKVLPHMAELLGVTTEAVVAAGHGDSAVSGCGAGVTESGSMVLVMGTSTCHQLMYREFRSFDGICSVAADGMIPGLYGYESGQPATGDVFSWFAQNCVPAPYAERARKEGKSLLDLLGEMAVQYKPGETGLVALDWLNGNRSILSNYNLSGLIVGMTLETRPEEIYRALVEANIFGSRKIIENYEKNGVEINAIYAVGGIARKSPWIMQMCADVFHKDIIVPWFDNVSARGAAVCAAVALGKADKKWGCRDFQEAAERLVPKEVVVYHPDSENGKLYDKVYSFYGILHDTFGLNDSFMKGLKGLKEIKREERYHE